MELSIDQIPPSIDFNHWVILGDRASGKTVAAASWLDQFARQAKQFLIVITPTPQQRDYFFETLRQVRQEGSLDFSRNTRRVDWPNSSQAYFFLPHEADRLRGMVIDGGVLEDVDIWSTQTAYWSYNLALRTTSPKTIITATYPNKLIEVAANSRNAYLSVIDHNSRLLENSLYGKYRCLT